MSTTCRFVVVCALLTACHHRPPPPVEGRADPGASPGDRSPDPIETLTTLAGAVRADDGAGLDALIHPDLGLWLWMQPGAMVAPAQRLYAGDGRPPRQRLDPDGFNGYWYENYWPAVAGGIEHALAHLDRDPPDRDDARYGDCGDDGSGEGEFRAWLSGGEQLSDLEVEMAGDGGVTLAPAQVHDLVHLHAWGLDVYLARDQGRLWVVHVMVWTPCDA